MVSGPKTIRGAKPGARIRRKTTTTSKRLSLSLDELRRQRELNKKQFAALVGCSAQYFSEVISCTGNPTVDTLSGWAKRLGMKCVVCFVTDEMDGASPSSEFMQKIVSASFILSDIPLVVAESQAEHSEAAEALPSRSDRSTSRPLRVRGG